MRLRWIGVLALAVLLAGCGRSNTEAKGPELTERQRDSILALQPIPGASVVGSALKASDKAAANATATESAVDSLAR
jgi:hypothetical protein